MAVLSFILLLISALLAHNQKSVRLWMGVFIASIIAAYLAAIIEVPGVLIAGSLVVLSHHYRVAIQPGHQISPLRDGATWSGLVALCLLLATHAAPGFNNILILDEVSLSPNSIPFTLYANYDKALIGLALLLLAVRRSTNIKEFFYGGVLLVGITVLAVLGAATFFGLIDWNPKFNEIFFTWAAINLLITCVAEETFFRLLIQEQILRWCSQCQYKVWISVIVSGVLFGMIHLSGGLLYASLATVAGLCYAYIYSRYRSLRIAIFTHFTVNTVHFLLFTYPRTI